MRDMVKRSGSKLGVAKGSVTHLGTTPYMFRVDIFVSYADNVKTADEVCVTWERRGKVEATACVKVKDKKAVFRQTLSMETTLFRKGAKGAPVTDTQELKFDEKKAKFLLRKGAADGKPIGKIALNLADYVRGTTGTVFADLKLSNGSVIVTKIESTMLRMGKKGKRGSNAGSEACSEMTDACSNENDSIFGDDVNDEDMADLEIICSSSPMSAASSKANETSTAPSPQLLPNASRPPTTDQVDESTKTRRSAVADQAATHSDSSTPSGPSSSSSFKSLLSVKKDKEGPDKGLKESPSLRNKIKSKIKTKKDKGEGTGGEEALAAETSSKRSKTTANNSAQIAELQASIESLKKENKRLKASKQAAMNEIDALRDELKASEEATEIASRGGGRGSGSMPARMITELKEKDKRIAELESQNDNLLEELEEAQHSSDTDNGGGERGGDNEEVAALRNQIEDLEIALRREPQYLDVVNELKVTKVSLALANMEKEQAQFALQSRSAALASAASPKRP